MGPDSPTRARPVFARCYAAMTARMDAAGLAELRTELLADVRGDVVEVGCGNGRNFRHYTAGVDVVHAVEPEPHLRALARDAAATTSVQVVAGTAEALPLGDASVDVGVACMVLCSVPDPRAAVAELHRVVRPGGSVVFLEHCAADTPWLRRVQRLADATVWPVLAGGCHTGRDPLATITDGGFAVETVRHLRYPRRPTVPVSPHVIGRALRR